MVVTSNYICIILGGELLFKMYIYIYIGIYVYIPPTCILPGACQGILKLNPPPLKCHIQNRIN